MAVSADSGAGKRISQKEFTEKAWQAVVSAPETAKNYSQQIVETEHMFKVMFAFLRSLDVLEQCVDVACMLNLNANPASMHPLA